MQALFARHGEIMLDLGKEGSVAKADRIAHRGAVHMRVILAAHLGHAHAPLKPRARARCSASALFASLRQLPSVRPFSPSSSPVPPNSVSEPSFASPGAKRTEVPAGISRCMPKLFSRSKSSALLVSKKW